MADSKESADALSGSGDPEQPKGVSSSKSGTTAAKRWSGNPVARLGRFVREVVAELRKVIYPTRKELITYTIVVVVFVTIVTSIVAGLDYGFGKAVLYVFGNPTADK